MLPVPPAISGVSALFISSFITKPPMPEGPSSPLCPVKHRASICNFRISKAKCPAAWALSTAKSTPCRRQMAPISPMG